MHGISPRCTYAGADVRSERYDSGTGAHLFSPTPGREPWGGWALTNEALALSRPWLVESGDRTLSWRAKPTVLRAMTYHTTLGAHTSCEVLGPTSMD